MQKSRMSSRQYITCNSTQKRVVSFVIEEFAEELTKMSGKCMDVGCGPGDITKNILLPSLDSNAVMIGTDIADDMIQFANQAYGDEKLLKFETLDIQTKNLPEKYVSQFDQIFSFNTLHWCNDVRQAFENIYDMLRPGGTMLIEMIASHDLFDVFRVMLQDIRYASYVQDVNKLYSPFHNSSQPRKEMRELLKNIGFKIRHCSLREDSFPVEKSCTFLSSILAFMTFLNGMPHDQLEEFNNNFVHEYLRRKLSYKQIHNNEERMKLLDLHTLFVIYAQKPAF